MRRVYFLVLGAVGACANIFGITGGVFDGGPGGDAAIDTAPPFDGGHIDPDANYADCGSGARAVSADAGVFVWSMGSDTNPCTVDQPCATIRRGIAVASQGSGGTVYIGPGVYNETLVFDVNSKPLSFQGGWDIDGGAWQPACVPSLATIQTPDASATVTLSHTTNEISFSLVKLVNTPSTVSNGDSVYGVFVDTSSLTLDNVEIFVGNAGHGTDATNRGPNGSMSGCTTPDNGADGDAGAPGSPALIQALETGFSAGTGTIGATGDPGHDGTPGGGGSCQTCNDSCTAGDPTACNDGGSGMPMCAPSGSTLCGDDGGPGCGGAGGGGGYPGTPGGSSVGVFVWAGNVSITNGAISAGAGGSGGNGMTGSSGAVGTPGTMGFSPTCYPKFCPSSGCYMMIPYCPPMGMGPPFMVNGGSAGGQGGSGGTGGRGGGGAGGNSFGIVAFANAKVTLSPQPYNVAVQAPAAGGAPNGPPGNSAPTNDF